MSLNRDYLAELINDDDIDWDEELKEEYEVLGDVWADIEFAPDEFIMEPEAYLALRLHEERLYSGYYTRQENQHEPE